MKYIITGSLGHVSKPVAIALVKAGRDVTVITSNPERVKEIEQIGAKAAVGSVEDPAFISGIFKTADVAYLMVPTPLTNEWREHQERVVDGYITALQTSNIKHVVVLSSIGAHRGTETGPIDGLAAFEKKLAALPHLHVKLLRPSYFFQNFYNQLGLIKHASIMGSNFGATTEKVVLTHTDDIARVAIEELLSLNFTGQSVRYISSDERSGSEIAAVLGAAVGKPSLPWIQFTDDESLNGMVQAGLAEGIASAYTTMGKSIRDGKVQEDYWKNKPSQLGQVKLEDFAKEFAAAYHTN
jgi:uncharacterized protein YbjT (DUF2867 family)